jgi:malonate transporter
VSPRSRSGWKWILFDGLLFKNTLMQVNPFFIFPDFALILFGAWLARRINFGAHFWSGAEKLVYYVFFPLLLFRSINAAQFSLDKASLFAAAGLTAFVASIALSFLGRLVLKPPPKVFASVVQTGFRYNSYVGLALAASLFGSSGVALFALLVVLCVPVANLFAVYALARERKTHLGYELITNPLIISTLSGLASNLLNIKLWPPLATVVERMGNASLALGLLCIGAGLTFRAVDTSRWVLGYYTVLKLLIVPLLMLAACSLFGVGRLESQVLILFAALPTASSAYILTTRMGGDGSPVAFLISLQTLLAMLTMPFWMVWVMG